MEPKLVRYLRIQLHTKGNVRLSYPRLNDYSYPDDRACYFSCDDGEFNQIYEGARRTLRLSTLDIFMDCPQRERGGWLCDSYFMSQAAWMMFGDLGVEKDFLENFLLTETRWKGFFPEVYPGSKKDPQDPGIINWSFWLAAELYGYFQRSGDREFIIRYKGRIEKFIEDLLSLRGESGLIETTETIFVDWSLSNRAFAAEPINIPNNCLVVYILKCMAKLYGRKDWQGAEEMQAVIETLDAVPGLEGGGGDAAKVTEENGQLRLVRTDCPTEGGQALELWSGFHRNDRDYVKKFLYTMDPCPEYRSDPNIGKANNFIGMMLRYDILADMGFIERLARELKNVYLEELRIGSGIFFENVNAFSGAHGFNGMVGTYLTERILGLGQPNESKKTVMIQPCPMNLRWARGKAECSDGSVYFKWSADQEEHTLHMTLSLPEGWRPEVQLPFSLAGWEVTLNGKERREYVTY